MEENKNIEDCAAPADECIEEATEGGEAVTEEAPKDELTELRERVAELEGELLLRDDKYLRMAAEYDNFRRRSREEKEAVYSSALADAVGAILPIIDNLERAAAFDDGDRVREGVKMIASTVPQALSALGVEAFGEVGDSFDPNLHNAVMHEEDESAEEGVITEVFQKGYKKGNRIIRFAMVKTVN